jgi:hypothetical protein
LLTIRLLSNASSQFHTSFITITALREEKSSGKVAGEKRKCFQSAIRMPESYRRREKIYHKHADKAVKTAEAGAMQVRCRCDAVASGSCARFTHLCTR